MSEPLDVRELRKPDKHPRVFEQFASLDVGESFVLVNNHDPGHLREEFERDHPRRVRLGLPAAGTGAVGDPDRQAGLDSAAPSHVRYRGARDRSAGPGCLWCRLEAADESAPFGR